MRLSCRWRMRSASPRLASLHDPSNGRRHPREATPWVTVGVAVTALLEAAQLPLDQLRSRLGGGGRLGGALKGALVGLATPLCSCGSLPVAAGFARDGVPLGTVVAFLTASQSSGLDSAAIT